MGDEQHRVSVLSCAMQETPLAGAHGAAMMPSGLGARAGQTDGAQAMKVWMRRTIVGLLEVALAPGALLV
jgi:hypothetical protein